MRLTYFHTFDLDGLGTQTQYPVGTTSGLVSLYGGGFDTLGGAINLQPRQVSYQFDLTNCDTTTLREQLDQFQAAMMHGRGMLRAINRDGLRLQTWAKVISASEARGPGSAGYQTVDVTFELFYPYWLAEDDEVYHLDDGLTFDSGWNFAYDRTDTAVITGATTPLSIDNIGAVPVARSLIIVTPRTGASLSAIRIHNITNHHEFTFSAPLAEGETLYIDTLSKTVHVDGSDAYNALDIGDRQRLWMALETGVNSMEIEAQDVTGTVDLTWAWARHYVL